ncbi:thioredoxin family protein [Gillisia sp. M10.2A]|uniref:Thioredoxin family protein n=1 Tax=Gillisia lutea TaxID=2909668 RepID=A0ABS9EHQ6_9FLAO|nr:thioredoxin family protein [Gillisia lutea]MCF4102395.1 thioredoxin family protein [Gillisia lutea]
MSLYILLLALITSCGNTNGTSQDTAQVVKEEVVSTTTLQQGMLVGEFKKEDLQQEPFASWFNSGYEGFTPSAEAMKTIKKNIGDYKIVAFMGTWCPDSRRETPKLFKILDDAGYDLSNLIIYGVDRRKSTPEKIETEYALNRVPTFIFLKNGKEVNRFVEYPQESIEADIAKIVSGEEYSNSYAK